MLALDVLSQYVSTHPYGISDGSADQLRYSLSSLQDHCGIISTGIFDTDMLNGWIDSMRETHKPDTIRTQRGNILTLWRFAFREGIVSEQPLKIRRLRPIRRSVEAWTIAEVQQLIAAAKRLRGHFRAVTWRRAPWTASLVMAGYDSGLRLGDLLRVSASQLSNESLRITQHKTGRIVYVRFRPETYAEILIAMSDHPDSKLLWPLWGRREALCRHIVKLVSAAGIRPGTFRWLRRTAATQVERMEPGRATELLGHASRSTTEQWYIDRSQLSTPPLPPL